MPEPASILSTATHPQLGGPASRLTEKTIVTVEGIQMPLAEAVRHGFVSRDAAGNYTNAPNAPAAADSSDAATSEGAAAVDTDDGPVAFPAEVEQAVVAFTADMPPQILDATVSQVIAGGIEAIDPKTAQTLGQDPVEFREDVSKTVAAFQLQADELVKRSGVEPAELWNWARENRREALQDAMRRHAYGRTVAGYKPIIAAYLDHVPISSHAASAAGYETRTEGGTEMIKIGGTWTTLKAAARAGLL
jgi:hypothetical protein